MKRCRVAVRHSAAMCAYVGVFTSVLDDRCVALSHGGGCFFFVSSDFSGMRRKALMKRCYRLRYGK